MVLDDELYICDGEFCGKTVKPETEDELRDFWSQWYSRLMLDLCPACRETETGKTLIAADIRAVRAITEQFYFGVNS